MTSDVLITAEHLSKQYRRGGARGVEHALRTLPGRLLTGLRGQGGRAESTPPDTFWALEDVSFTLAAGEVLGLVGANGAGKTTLLKIVAQITQPTGGRAEVRGRVAPLLHLGTGFHPDLTGRENIYLNGTILGMRRAAIARHFDEIVAFAGVDRFVDTPLKRYSAGMSLRLAFSVAACLDAHILILDEALGVGDVAFRRAALERIRAAALAGRGVIVVSHAMPILDRLCTRAIWLDAGRVRAEGPVRAVTAAYERHMLPESPTDTVFPNVTNAGGISLDAVDISVENRTMKPLLASPRTSPPATRADTARQPGRAASAGLPILVLGVCVAATLFGLKLAPYRSTFGEPSPYERLPATFQVWDRVPVSEHRLLVFERDGEFEKRRAYNHFSPAFMGTAYLVVRTARAFGAPYPIGQRALPLVAFGVMLLLVCAQARSLQRRLVPPPSIESAMVIVLALLAACCVVTLPVYWIGVARANPENVFLTGPLAFAFLGATNFRGSPDGLAAFVVLALLTLLAPMYGPLALLYSLVLWRASPSFRLTPLRRAAVLATLTVLSVVIPTVMAATGGFDVVGSGMRYRMGLDGSTQYFSSIVQAVVSPIDPTRFAYVSPFPLVALIGCGAGWFVSRSVGERMMRHLFICLTPYLWMAVMFPQAVSIHPYLFDFGLIFGPALCLFVWLTDPELGAALDRRPALQLFLLFILLGLLMTNYIGLARLPPAA